MYYTMVYITKFKSKITRDYITKYRLEILNLAKFYYIPFPQHKIIIEVKFKKRRYNDYFAR